MSNGKRSGLLAGGIGAVVAMIGLSLLCDSAQAVKSDDKVHVVLNDVLEHDGAIVFQVRIQAKAGAHVKVVCLKGKHDRMDFTLPGKPGSQGEATVTILGDQLDRTVNQAKFLLQLKTATACDEIIETGALPAGKKLKDLLVPHVYSGKIPYNRPVAWVDFRGASYGVFVQ